MSPAATTLHELAVATDTRLAELHGQASEIQDRINRAANTIKQYAGAERNRWGLYNMTLDQAEAIIATEGWEPRRPVAWWGRPGGDVDKARETIDAARAELAPIHTEIADCDQTWQDNGCWARFFLVPGGHIHSSMNCSTCNRGHEPTQFGWLPNLSGLTEADAVKAHGALLCTTCFPSAPVAWTNGDPTAKPGQCAGSRTGDYPRDTARTGYYSGNYGVCSHCGQRITLTNTGRMRVHQAEPPAPKKRASRKPAAPVVSQVDETWEAMQSPELDDALRVFKALEIACGAATEGQTYEATRIAYRAMQALAPEGWSAYRRTKDLGLTVR